MPSFDTHSTNITCSGMISGNGSRGQSRQRHSCSERHNTFSGGTTISAGTLQLGHAMLWGRPLPRGVSGGTLDLGGFSPAGPSPATQAVRWPWALPRSPSATARQRHARRRHYWHRRQPGHQRFGHHRAARHNSFSGPTTLTASGTLILANPLALATQHAGLRQRPWQS